MRADELVKQAGARLVGRTIRTEPMGKVPGGYARVTELLPDEGAPEIPFQVRNPAIEAIDELPGGLVGVFDYEEVALVELSARRNKYFALLTEDGKLQATLGIHSAVTEEGHITVGRGDSPMWDGPAPPWCAQIVKVFSFYPWVGARRMQDFRVIWTKEGANTCRGCGVAAQTIYCAGCSWAGRALCPHGNPASECNDCMVEGDLAFDAARETYEPPEKKY